MPLLDEVELATRADDVVAGYSAGMRKRLGLARILLKDPPVVFLDEPYGALDPPGFRKVDALIARLRERGATVLVATHLLDRVGPLCDEGLVLTEGRVSWQGRAADVARLGGVDPGGLAE
jgi:ABC-type multidrug transport system ATPase subunit